MKLLTKEKFNSYNSELILTLRKKYSIDFFGKRRLYSTKGKNILGQGKVAITKLLLHSSASQILCDDTFLNTLKPTIAYSCHKRKQTLIRGCSNYRMHYKLYLV